MVVTAKQQKKSSANPVELNPKKDFSGLYKKSQPITIPIKVPSMNLDVELEYTPPTQEVEALLDRYIIAVALSYENSGIDRSDEDWLKIGKRQLVDLSAYLKKSGTKVRGANLVEEAGDEALLKPLRDRMAVALAELELALEPKYEEYEKLSYYMVSEPDALAILHNCIALCFKEIEEPEQLADQVKFFLMVSLLSVTGRVLAI